MKSDSGTTLQLDEEQVPAEDKEVTSQIINKSYSRRISESNRDFVTAWQAAWNIFSAIQSVFIFSFPFAVHEAGYWALFFMILVAAMSCRTGLVLIKCLYKEDENGDLVRVRSSYRDIAAFVWGNQIGIQFVNFIQIFDLTLFSTLYIVFCGELLDGCFPMLNLSKTAWCLITGIAVLPYAAINTLKRVSIFSFLSSLAHVVVSGILIIYCTTLYSQWKPRSVPLKIDVEKLCVSLGIIVFSFGSQAFLPIIEGTLIDRSSFKTVLYDTHAVAAGLNFLIGYIGFITFEENTKEVITNNIENNYLRQAVNISMIIKAILAYSLTYYTTFRLVETAIFTDTESKKISSLFYSCYSEEGKPKCAALMFRIFIIIITILLATFIPHLALLTAFTGSLTGAIMYFILPAYFHLKINKKMRWFWQVTDGAIVVLGILFAIGGTYLSGSALYKAVKTTEITFVENSTESYSNFSLTFS